MFVSRFFERVFIFISVVALIFAVLFTFVDNYAVFLVAAGAELVYIMLLNFALVKEVTIGFHFRLALLGEVLILVFCYFFVNSVSLGIVFAVTLVEYFFTSTFFETYVIHQLFEEECENKSGTDLSNHLYNNRFIGEDYAKKVKALTNMLIVSSVLSIAVCFAISFNNTYVLPLPTLLCLGIYFASNLVHYMILNTYQNELYYAFLGLEEVFSYRRFAMFAGFPVIAAGAILGTLFSSNHPILKPEYFTGLFGGKKTVSAGNITHVPVPEFNSDMTVDYAEGIRKVLGTQDENVLVGKILDGILIAVFIGFVLYFIFRPIIKKTIKEPFENRSIPSIIKKFAANFIEMIKKLFSFRFSAKKNYVSVEARSFRSSMSEFISQAKKSKEKKAELDRLTKVFMRLIDWGNENGVPYKTNLAPMEYAALFKKETAATAGRIFEKALYSEELISEEEEKQFKDSIAAVIK